MNKPRLTRDENELLPFIVRRYVESPIKALRIEASVSREELAQRLGVTQGYISKIERPGHKVTDKLKARVEVALNRGRKG